MAAELLCDEMLAAVQCELAGYWGHEPRADWPDDWSVDAPVLQTLAELNGVNRARPHARLLALYVTHVHFIPLSLTYSVPLSPKRQCDRRTPGVKARANADFRAHRYALVIEGYSAVLAALDDASERSDDADDASPLPALEALRVTSLANRAQARGRGRRRLCTARTSLQTSLAAGGVVN
jgi:hypothetical protein